MTRIPDKELLINAVDFISWDSTFGLYQRFWAQVDKSGDCWIWTGRRYGEYGQVSGRRPEGQRSMRAHRVSYEWANGVIPPRLLVLHSCDTPLCVRPEHLFVGTYKDNTDDMVRKGRAGWQQEGWRERCRKNLQPRIPADDLDNSTAGMVE